MSYASESNRLLALEHFVRRLYVADCLQSGDPIERLGQHKSFAEALVKDLLELVYRTTDTDVAKENCEIAVSISAFLGTISEEVRHSVGRQNAS